MDGHDEAEKRTGEQWLGGVIYIFDPYPEGLSRLLRRKFVDPILRQMQIDGEEKVFV